MGGRHAKISKSKVKIIIWKRNFTKRNGWGESYYYKTAYIIKVSGKNGGYYVGERDFELPELKLLVDAVQTSKFITKKKSAELIGKIERLTSKYQAQVLHRQVYVSARIKNMNESIYYNVDKIYHSIEENKIPYHNLKISYIPSKWKKITNAKKYFKK